MKALSLTQPWATLIAIGAKRIETRSWSTRFRGPIAIHASRTFPHEARYACWAEPFRSVLSKADLVDYRDFSDLESDSMERFEGLALGAIVAIARLVDVIPTQDVTRMSQGLLKHEIEFGDYDPGRFAWLLTDVVSLTAPIPAKGSLGLWNTK